MVTVFDLTDFSHELESATVKSQQRLKKAFKDWANK
jgi:hypothetical protein